MVLMNSENPIKMWENPGNAGCPVNQYFLNILEHKHLLFKNIVSNAPILDLSDSAHLLHVIDGSFQSTNPLIYIQTRFCSTDHP